MDVAGRVPKGGTLRPSIRSLISPMESAIEQNLRAATPSILADVNTLIGLWKLKTSLLHPESDGCIEVERDLTSLSTDVLSGLVFGDGYQRLEGTIRVVEAEGIRDKGQGFSQFVSELAAAAEVVIAVRVLLDFCKAGLLC